tara:strand:+ start:952 stop:1416 length:465 start_codon:yes stop_codon:yes gene_type:complete
MRKIIYLFILISLICCKEKSHEHDYFFIEQEIKIYNNLLLVKTIDYLNYAKEKEKINSLQSKILDLYYETDALVDVINENDVNKIDFSVYENYLEQNYSICYTALDKIKTDYLHDTLYLHNLKFNYIKCVLKKSEYYDSIPELKKRILNSEIFQ